MCKCVYTGAYAEHAPAYLHPVTRIAHAYNQYSSHVASESLFGANLSVSGAAIIFEVCRVRFKLILLLQSQTNSESACSKKYATKFNEQWLGDTALAVETSFEQAKSSLIPNTVARQRAHSAVSSSG